MVLTNVITIPFGKKTSPFSRVTPDFIQGFYNICHQITYLDRIIALDLSVWVQVNNAKVTYLFQSSLPPSCESEVWDGTPSRASGFSKVGHVCFDING
jgi:hypothetical protein